MARLALVINNGREAVYDLVDLTIKKQRCRVTFDIGDCLKNGWPVTIDGPKADLEKLRTAFKKKGETASIGE